MNLEYLPQSMLEMLKINKNYKNEKGMSSILIVVLISALVIIFSASLSLTTLLASEAAINNDKSDDVFYVAESGIEDTLRIISLNSNYNPSGGTVLSIGSYVPDIELVDAENLIERLSVTSTSSGITRRTSVVLRRLSSGPPEAANYGMYAGQELAFLHNANSPQTKGRLRGDIYAKDRIRLVGFITGDETGATRTKIVSAGSYGSGSQIGSQQDQLYKNSETYYTDMYTLNDVSTHPSANANNLTVYYKSSTQQQINLPSGTNNTKILDPNILVDEINNPEFNFERACTQETGETETIYSYSNQTALVSYINSRSGNLESGIHCVESGNVTINNSVPITLDGSIITKSGNLTITNNLDLTNSYSLPVLASSGTLILGNNSTNNPAPNNADIDGIIYANQDIYIANYGQNGSTTPYFNMIGAVWARGNLFVVQNNNIRVLNVDITFDPNRTQNIKDFSSQVVSGFELLQWDESYD